MHHNDGWKALHHLNALNDPLAFSSGVLVLMGLAVIGQTWHAESPMFYLQKWPNYKEHVDFWRRLFQVFSSLCPGTWSSDTGILQETVPWVNMSIHLLKQRANNSLFKPNPALNLCAVVGNFTTFKFFYVTLVRDLFAFAQVEGNWSFCSKDPVPQGCLYDLNIYGFLVARRYTGDKP